MKSVILMGATGATGSKILPLLLHEGKVGKVTAFLRKPIPDHEKLTQVIVKDFKKLEESTKLDQWNSDIIINALGSTRVMAGSGEEFVRIERDYGKSAMELAKKAGQCIKSITISAQGANPNFPGPLWFHPLLYVRTLGEKENAALSQVFQHNTIIRPGPLDRENHHSTGHMPFLAGLMPSQLPVSILAKAVLFEVVKDEPQAPTPPLIVSGNPSIKKHALNYSPSTKA